MDYGNAPREWKEEEGVYVNRESEMWFPSVDKYKHGEHTANSFVKDGLVRVLSGGEESAEILAKIAIDNKRKLWLWALKTSGLTSAEQRVADLVDGGRLGV